MKKGKFDLAGAFLSRSGLGKILQGRTRNSLRGSLKHIKRLGFEPRTVLDVGAAAGTPELYNVFPKARHILIEPLEENRPCLEGVAKKYENVEYILAAATRQSGQITINVHPDLMGSSVYLEREDSDVNGSPRIVAAVSLDELYRKGKVEAPCLLKVDVQGAEIDVLSGAEQTLKITEYAVLECSLFQFFEGGPQLADVIDFMRERKFTVYDLFGFQYRLLDGSMSQVDIAFVKEEGIFRQSHVYATREQRDRQNKRFARTRECRKQEGPPGDKLA